ncbi:DUF5702 domain-containing protein, partial [Pseudomonas sp. 2822-15]|uniref:DUF5702 domain-containing protein n=1 Tax=Pseudomonas sp. 2822-15 TaxID=1712677 RepID=UPI00117AA496
MYTNEYILMNFESTEPDNMLDPNDYTFDKREVEFILYGKFESAENYEMALLQLFAIRFAFRLIDAFTQDHVRGAGHPILVFVAAVGHALTTGINDVRLLASNEEVE